MSSDDLIEIAKKGLGLPLISLMISIIIYILKEIMTAFANLPLPTGSKFEMPGYTNYFALVGIMIFLMNYCGYFEDFRNGAEYPKYGVIYGVSASVGLIFFWNAIAVIDQGGIGQDTIISSIITIILSFGGAAISYYYFRR